MSLLSVEFYILTAAALAVYYTLLRNRQWVFLLVLSLAVFLLISAAHTIIYLIVSILSVYAASRVISSGRTGPKGKKAALIIAITINISMLAALKYVDSFLYGIGVLTDLSGVKSQSNAVTTGWVASIGISFYTLQIIGYLCDVYWGVSQAQGNPFKLALFTGYFPQMISGPISRYSQLGTQLFAKHSFDFNAVTSGAQRILAGLAKKLIIAERISPFVNTVFNQHSEYSGYAGLAALLFSVQLYADFSGSMDIVIGISECFGIKLPENFKNPFFSRTVQEFWQRWHITLGTWFKDYLMFPVMKSGLWRKMGKGLRTMFGKSAAGKAAARMIPGFLGMLILWAGIGIWHGGGMKFLFQGLWFWLVIMLGQVTAPLSGKIFKPVKNTDSSSNIRKIPQFLYHLFQSAGTCIIFAAGLVFFRADSLQDAFAILKNALTVFSPSLVFSGDTAVLMGGRENILIIAAGSLVMLITGYMGYRGVDIRRRIARQNIAVRWALYYALIFCVLLLGRYGSNYNPADFIYGGF